MQTIISILIGIVVVWFLENYFPGYLKKKGENLATKEDVKKITEITEDVQKEFREQFELFSSDVRFKYEFYYKQYSELYCNLYSIIIQSEYCRYFIYLSEGQEWKFYECPFIEISPIKRVNMKTEWEAGKPKKYTEKTEIIDTPISKFNKEQLCDYIITNGQYASQKLLKLAVSYRFAYNHYGDNNITNNKKMKDTANDEELRLIREIICCIVKEYNELRRELKMDFNADELNNGIIEIKQ